MKVLNFSVYKALFSFIAFFLALVIHDAQGQNYDPLHPPNSYQSSKNPYYWKNNSPSKDYWQQDVHYTINANIDEKANIIDATQQLTYWNNSPDTLYEVFFHLFQNAFQPGSYYDNLQNNNKRKPRYGQYEAEGLGTEIQSIKSKDEDLVTELDNTILKVILNKPLLPGEKMDFDIIFKTYYGSGSVRRRMKYYYSYGYKHFNAVHWYPSICVYDKKFGWTKDQHLGREFYHNFGTFDVELTFANDYIVEATGFLQNRAEVMPDSLRKKLDVSNFKDKPLNEKPSVIIVRDSTVRKTWKYHAENVHNFAFTASPIYRIGEAEWNGIKAIALVEEPHASKWQKTAEFTADVLRVFSKDFGMYGYHKMVVADARDGMEYPMLTLCGGTDPGNRGLIAHEVGHNWFYGMIGNNESYRAAMDEGFTQFLTAWGLEAIDGKYQKRNAYKRWYLRKFKEPVEIRNSRVYYGYLRDAIREQDAYLNTHSDAFHGALRHGGGYGHVYYKTAAMLYNLQYVLGDTLFQNAMKHYFNKWKFKHPYVADFRQSIIEYTNTDLNWFFDQWLETIKNIDYKVKKVKKSGKTPSGFTYDIKFKRKGRMQMPIDFSVVTKANDTIDYHIPNQWFVKETDAQVLKKWHGWDKLHPTYSASILVSDEIKNLIIDPSKRKADIYMPDNSKRPPIKFKFDSRVYNYPDWKHYRMYMRPALWWNAYDGIKAGVHWRGHYMNYKHKFALTVLGNTSLLQGSSNTYNYPESQKRGFDPISYAFSYETGIDKLVKDVSVFFKSKYMDGLEAYETGFASSIGKRSKFSFYIKLMTRPKPEKLNYLLYPGEWEAEKINNSLNATFTHNYRRSKGNGSLDFHLRTSNIASDFDYHFLDITHINHTKFWRLELHSRVFGRYGTGSDWAKESSLYFAQANNEALMDDMLTRSKGFVPPSWVGFGADVNHFHQGGGLNVRGYAGYLLAEASDAGVSSAFRGNSGASFNVELDFDGIVRKKPKWLRDHVHLDTYLFADGGFIVFENTGGNNQVSDFRMDAGAGIALTIKNFGGLQQLKPFTIRFDVPFYLSHAPNVDPDNWAFRWVVGINRAF